ncbi:adenosylcobalamin-dependent ribonucleoside-diphosphate reductase [Candidatus Pacearchaeota archaeon]|jgi:ribonucleoside-diphosphate reductase alpha chain|nr:adenosylcobalamin-dependent ribonucleoside-diphosphate reductase [Candidatus Pacearchaeota archaeon]
MTKQFYSLDEVKEATLKYFDDDHLATDTWMKKYALKDKKGNFLELTPDDMHHRLAKEFARIESNYMKPLTEDEIYSYFKDFKYIIPQGSPMFGIGNSYSNSSLSNCIVVDSPLDTMSGIFNSARDLANLFKRRCGVGIDVSTLRPSGAAVNNSAGTSTGAWSFVDFYSSVCKLIGQNGRRAALMISMDVQHPDIEKFISLKEDLQKVTGANISVKLTDSFMEAVQHNEEFVLKWPINSKEPKYTKTIKALDLWNKIINCATKTGDPGLLMWDNITNYLPAHFYKEEGFEALTTNPCGEIPLSGYDSCRLISINLKNFIVNPFSPNSFVDLNTFRKVVSVAMRLSDDLIDLEIEKLYNLIEITDEEDEKEIWKKLIKSAQEGRRTGLGTNGLADALSRLNMIYGSPEAIEMTDMIYEELKLGAYQESIKLGIERGIFPIFNWKKERTCKFFNSFTPDVIKDMENFGRRNISILTNAPTAGVSIIAQTSFGIEPIFRNSYKRRRKLNFDEQDKFLNAEVTEDGEKWFSYDVFHKNIKDYQNVTNKNDTPDIFIESNNVPWKQRIEMQSAIQRHIDQSISSTINLPIGTTSETVGTIYEEAWSKKLKGITVFVEGCRKGVLVSKDMLEQPTNFHQVDAVIRPKELECDIHHINVKSKKWIVFVGLMNGKPYEVFAGRSFFVGIPTAYKKGILVKHSYKTKPSHYDLIFDKENDGFVLDVVKTFKNPNHGTLTRLISNSLRHGAKPRILVEQLNKDDPDSDFTSINKTLARVLKKYIINGEEADKQYCPDCGSQLIYIDGCVSCSQCGWGKCS